MRKLRVLTWHVHGSYLYYLTQAHHEFHLPVKEGRPEGYGGRSGNFDWGDNVHDVPADQVRAQDYDVIVYQSHRNWNVDRHEILSDAQRTQPSVFLEHDPPRESPTDTLHPVNDPNVLLVHVTAFNDLMWDAQRTPTTVIDHGVIVPEHARWTGERERGIVVVNDLPRRGRRLGLDVFERARQNVPLDLAGINSGQLGGMGPVPLKQLHDDIGQYRFFFNPIRYTSMGLAVCEAMMIGLPIVGLATTEMATAVRNGVNGYVDTNVDALGTYMNELLRNPKLAAELSEGARRVARERFGIERFAVDWDRVLRDVAGAPARAVAAGGTA